MSMKWLKIKRTFSKAIALNSAMFNTARLVAHHCRFISRALGEGFCFLINAVSFFAIIFTLLAMNIPKRKPESRTSPCLTTEGRLHTPSVPSYSQASGRLALMRLMGMPNMVLSRF
jgi:hypothetical protein